MKTCTQLAGLCLALFLFLFTLPNNLNAQTPHNVAKKVTLSGVAVIPFLEYRPAGHDAPGNTRTYPLIIFLHGGGERSNDTLISAGAHVWNLQNFGPSQMVKLGNPMTFTWNNRVDTFIIISPMSGNFTQWSVNRINRVLAYAKDSLKIDTNRIYLTGMSFGGGGTFRYLSYANGDAKKLAAAAPVCATPWQFEANGAQYVGEAKLPIWAFHAKDDSTNKYNEGTVPPINAITNRVPPPAVKAQMTLWPTGGHGISPRVYNIETYPDGYDGILNIYEWFLGQNKSLPVNVLPVADAGGDFNVAKSPGTATLDASHSTDADSGIVRYVWKKISAPSGVSLSSITIANPRSANATTTVSGLTTAGQYTFQLFVVDTRAAVDTDEVVITAVDSVADQFPIADAGSDKTITLPVDSVRVFGEVSDPDGPTPSFVWEYVDGPATYTIYPNASAINPIFKNLQEGVYHFRLKATDDDGAIAYDTVMITVNSAINEPPFAYAGNDKTITLPLDTVRTYGTVSDPDGPTPSFIWEYVDGPSTYTIYPNVYALNPVFKNLQQGTYHFRLKATDEDGAITYDTLKITVNPAGDDAVLAEYPEPEQGEMKLTVSVNPNPVRDVLNLTLNGSETGRTVIAVYDAGGALRKTQHTQKATTYLRKSITISGLSSGVYYLHVTVNGKQHIGKFIRQ
jgi:poly(3-hydroxybutyrate) depolymerase